MVILPGIALRRTHSSSQVPFGVEPGTSSHWPNRGLKTAQNRSDSIKLGVLGLTPAALALAKLTDKYLSVLSKHLVKAQKFGGFRGEIAAQVVNSHVEPTS